MYKKIIILLLGVINVFGAYAQEVISFSDSGTDFPIVNGGVATSVLADKLDDSLVDIASKLFITDVEKVTGKKPTYINALKKQENIIIAGTLAQSVFIKKLVKSKKLNVSALSGKWDAYNIVVINKPLKGVNKALVVVGSNKRGVAYGLLELSRQMGVSPWYWWADVPVINRTNVFVKADTDLTDAPKVKYRGIFINDEAPALSGWIQQNYGSFNNKFYVNVFELLLRLKANYMWPAMWGSAFNANDSLNPVLANRWGIVMGTSHHEPMLRSQQEWKMFGRGPWDYTKNKTVLSQFWEQGIRNMGNHESVVTIGMRGDGDEPMTEGTATALLENIVNDQRAIIEKVTGKPAEKTPQLWALYKEVQDYYDKGMRVPDDVTLLLCDDNWGNIRKLPKKDEKLRKGGYGIYYHFDYVGDPRNYKWINTNNIARVWEQMHMAWEYNAREIWIVNVGDIKPMEFPISFFLDYAWNPDAWQPENLRQYYGRWAAAQFGEKDAADIGKLLQKYGQIAARRKPELTNEQTYSIENYDESERILSDFTSLEDKAIAIGNSLLPMCKDAYYQLVLHPIKANANLHRLYAAVAHNHKYALQHDLRANTYADLAKKLFANDSLITLQYNKNLAGGKWNHFMDQTHIGYTSWNEPPKNIMPKVYYIGNDEAVTKQVDTKTPEKSAKTMVPGTHSGYAFFEKDGCVSIHAEHFTEKKETNGMVWKILPDIGRVSSGIALFPVTESTITIDENSPHLNYEFYCYSVGNLSVNTFFSPTLNFHNVDYGLRYAVSVDDGPIQIISINADKELPVWRKWVSDNAIQKVTVHSVKNPGKHTLKIWLVDGGIVLQNILLDFGGLKNSYLGPKETVIKN